MGILGYMILELQYVYVLIGCGMVCLPMLLGLRMLQLACRLPFTKVPVLNLNDRAAFTAPRIPGFYDQPIESRRLLAFARRVPHVAVRPDRTFEGALGAMRWVREMQGRNWIPPYSDLDDPDELLDEMAAGKSGACRRCSQVLVGALLAMRLRARLVVGTPGFDQREVSHCLVEVWIGEMGKWVLLDPTFDTAFDLDGKPASLFEVYQAYREGEQQRLQFARRGSTFLPAPAHEFYRRVFRHIYIAKTNAIFEGYAVRLVPYKQIVFMHYCDGKTPPYPQRKKLCYLLAGPALVIAPPLAAALAFFKS
jgi:hypothetical protein